MSVKFAAGTQIDLAMRGGPRRGGEPLDDMLGLGPGGPDEFPGHINDAFENEIKLWIGFPQGHVISP